MLEVSNLSVQVEGKPILKDVSLTIRPGEIHAVMGPNGAGKSTLAKVVAGHPSYDVLSGTIRFNGRDILELDPEERAHLGIFMSFQYPVEIVGVTTADFLRAALNANRKAQGIDAMTEKEFDTYVAEKMALLDMKSEFRERFVNEGFSGGEKKRNEILQMAVLQPQLAILDETDSGLDIDAMKVVAGGVNKLTSPEKSLLLITHYQRLLDYIKPHFVHVMIDGAIVLSGGAELAHELDSKGYDWLATGEEEEADDH